MSASPQFKDFEDPLYAGMQDRKKKKELPRSTPGNSPAPRKPGSSRTTVVAIGLVLVLAGLIYFLYEAQQKIDALNTSLSSNQVELAAVQQNLETSQQQIETLNDGLDSSRSQLQNQNRELSRYKNLYSNIKTEQAQQTRDLEAISIQKANQSEVAALKNQTEQIKQQADEVKQQVTQANSGIADLREMATRSRADIDANQSAVVSLQEKVTTHETELADVKNSLDREIFNFELQEKSGIMKVFNVGLSLRDVDYGKQRFDLDLLVDGKRIKKDDQYINEPIYFYPAGAKKAYEIVVNKIDKKYVVGYLSIPKADQDSTGTVSP